jgi:hypothetical protein
VVRISNSNYIVIANSEIVEFTPARTKFPKSEVPLPVVAWCRVPKMSSDYVLTLLAVDPQLILLSIQHGPRRVHCSSLL